MGTNLRRSAKRDAWQKPHEVIRALAPKPDAVIADIGVIDFRMDSPVGPPRSARIAPSQVRSEFERAGYDLVHEHDFLPHQYFLVFGATPP